MEMYGLKAKSTYKNVEHVKQRKLEHQAAFPRLLNPPDGFEKHEYPRHWSMHSIAVDGEVSVLLY